MILFVVLLLAALIVSGLSLYLFFRGLKNNWHQKNKRPISYLAPVLLMIFLVAFSAAQTIPRLLDLAYLAGGTLQTEEMSFEQGDMGRLRFISNGRQYYFYNADSELVPDQSYRVSYTPYSRHVIRLVNLAESITD